MRFDDRLETALKGGTPNTENNAIQWQQLIDILAQSPTHFPTELVAAGLIRAHRQLPDIPLAIRVACVKSLHGRLRSAPLLQLLANDESVVAAAAIAAARLEDHEWADIIPDLPIRARGFLRNRRDLGPLSTRMLSVWSAGDYVLPDLSDEVDDTDEAHVDSGSVKQAEGTKPAQASGTARQDPTIANTQISLIVERIERLRRDREAAEAPELALEGGEDRLKVQRLNEIRFETDDHGTISWVEGAPRGAIVGVSISEPAFDDGPGPDAYGAAAFRQRMPLENARMRLCGAMIIEGDWRINASAFFDPASGRFRGYRGILRRPTLAESAQFIEQSVAQGDHLQQLIHELRTPLGAIIGFSEIIQQQLFGPVSADYRKLAGDILSDGQRLLTGFDDIAIAAKIDSGRLVVSNGTTECDWLTNLLAERLHELSDNLGVTLNLVRADPVRPFAIDIEMAERLFSRLLSAVIIGGEKDEELSGRFQTDLGLRAMNRFTISLPRKLRGRTEEALFGTGPSTTEDLRDAPLLGLGFSLRLVRNLARSVGGDLRFRNETLILVIPASQGGNVHYRDNNNE